jgi:hypothetical protein
VGCTEPEAGPRIQSSLACSSPREKRSVQRKTHSGTAGTSRIKEESEEGREQILDCEAHTAYSTGMKFIEISDLSCSYLINLDDVSSVKHHNGYLAIYMKQGVDSPVVADEDCIQYGLISIALGLK